MVLLRLTCGTHLVHLRTTIGPAMVLQLVEICHGPFVAQYGSHLVKDWVSYGIIKVVLIWPNSGPVIGY